MRGRAQTVGRTFHITAMLGVMRRAILLFLPSLVLLCSCAKNPRHWLPQDASVERAHAECLQQGEELLCSCMAAKGYTLTRLSTTEQVMIGIVTSPIWLPPTVLTGMWAPDKFDLLKRNGCDR